MCLKTAWWVSDSVDPDALFCCVWYEYTFFSDQLVRILRENTVHPVYTLAILSGYCIQGWKGIVTKAVIYFPGLWKATACRDAFCPGNSPVTKLLPSTLGSYSRMLLSIIFDVRYFIYNTTVMRSLIWAFFFRQYNYSQDGKGSDQTVWMRRLSVIWVVAVRIWQKGHFSQVNYLIIQPRLEKLGLWAIYSNNEVPERLYILAEHKFQYPMIS